MATLAKGVTEERKINGKPLSADIQLTASDIGAVSLTEPDTITGAKTFTGEVLYPATPIAGTEISNKNYVDNKVRTELESVAWDSFLTTNTVQDINAAKVFKANISVSGAAVNLATATSVNVPTPLVRPNAVNKGHMDDAIAAHEQAASAHSIAGVAGLQTALDGKQAVNAVLSGISAGTTALSFRNKIINGDFSINQRGYVSGAATTAGQYTLDRWKVTGTGGITFSTVNGKTTATIPSGQTLVQIIEAANLSAGDYVLSWSGTAQGRIASGAYGTSGNVKFTATGGSNVSIEFSAGALGYVQLECSYAATTFEHRPYGYELSLCQRYFRRYKLDSYLLALGYNSTTLFMPIHYEPPMRSAPSVTIGNSNVMCMSQPDTPATAGTLVTNTAGINDSLLGVNGNFNSSKQTWLISSSTAYVDFSSEI